MSFAGPKGMTLTFGTQTVQQRDHISYTDSDEEQQTVEANGGSLQVLSKDTRVVPGMPGLEIRISVMPGNEPPFLRFRWHFPGEPGSSTRPKTDITGSARSSHSAALETIWEAALGSLQPIPLAKR
jgi:hypothetical protein